MEHTTVNLMNRNLTDETFPIVPEGVKFIYAYNNALTKVPINLPSTLEVLHLGNNKIRKLENLPKKLQYLYCESNGLEENDTFPDTIEKVVLDNNSLTTLPTLPNRMYYLSLKNNNVKMLPNIPDSLVDVCFKNNPVPQSLLDFRDCSEYILDLDFSYKSPYIIKWIKYFRREMPWKFWDIDDFHL